MISSFQDIRDMWVDVPEIWAEVYYKDATGYRVSNFGRVYCSNREEILKVQYNQRGNAYVNLRGSKRYGCSVAVLVAETFVNTSLVDENVVVVHKDGDKRNNHAMNLCWRSRGYAARYRQQITSTRLIESILPIVETESGLSFSNALFAGAFYGFHYNDVISNLLSNTRLQYGQGLKFKQFEDVIGGSNVSIDE